MTRFKELRRIEGAIEHSDQADLRWASDYCLIRVSMCRTKSAESYWHHIEKRVRAAIIKNERSSHQAQGVAPVASGSPAPRQRRLKHGVDRDFRHRELQTRGVLLARGVDLLQNLLRERGRALNTGERAESQDPRP